MAWYARAIERSLDLPHVVLGRDYLRNCLRDLQEQLGGPNGQVLFHETNAARCGRLEHRLHRLELCLLGLTLLCCLQHLAQSFFPAWVHVSSGLLTFCCGFFPATGAALAGISNQAEFRADFTAISLDGRATPVAT